MIGAAAFVGYKVATGSTSSISTESELLPDEPAKPTTSSKTPQPSAPVSSSFPLVVGSRGELVKQLQKVLGVTADGIFGEKTKAALITNFAIEKVPATATLQRILAGTQPSQPQGSPSTVQPQYPVGQMILAMYQPNTVNGKNIVIQRSLYDNTKIIDLLTTRVGNQVVDRPNSYLKAFRDAFNNYYKKVAVGIGNGRIIETRSIRMVESMSDSSNATVKRLAKKIADL